MAITVQNLVNDVRVMSGLRDNQYFTDNQIVTLLSDANQELHDTIMRANEHHLMRSFDFSLLGGTGVGNDQMPLPDDFMQGHSVDGDRDLQSQYTVRYLRSWLERNDSKLASRPRYFFRGNSIVFYPQERAAGTYRMWYTPIADRLSLDKTVSFALATSDIPEVPPPGSLAGTGAWELANANAAAATDIPTSGFDLVLTFTTTNLGFSGTYHVVDVGLPPAFGSPTFSTSNLASTAGFSSPPTGTGTYTYTPNGTVSTLPAVITPYSQFLKLHASIAIRQGREKDETDLVQKLTKYSAQMTSNITNRAEEPEQPPLTRRTGDFVGWGDEATIEWAR